MKTPLTFVFGFTVYESFESSEVARTGIVSIPQPSERSLGGHAVLAVGYDNVQKRFIVRNSWGTDWGQGGYYYMPLSVFAQDASDFWQIATVSDPGKPQPAPVQTADQVLAAAMRTWLKTKQL